jgi:hypothetical protein
MDSSLIGLVGLIVVVLIAEAVGIYLRRPLGVILRTEKGGERSDFWSAYIRIILLLVPAAFALVSFPESSHHDPVMAFVEQLRWGLAGLLLTLAVAGKAIHIPSPRRITHAPYVPPVPPPPPPPSSGSAR